MSVPRRTEKGNTVTRRNCFKLSYLLIHSASIFMLVRYFRDKYAMSEDIDRHTSFLEDAVNLYCASREPVEDRGV